MGRYQKSRMDKGRRKRKRRIKRKETRRRTKRRIEGSQGGFDSKQVEEKPKKEAKGKKEGKKKTNKKEKQSKCIGCVSHDLINVIRKHGCYIIIPMYPVTRSPTTALMPKDHQILINTSRLLSNKQFHLNIKNP